MNPIVILIRCNASQFIGAGHVMRCLSLAKRLQTDKVSCVFLSNREGLDLIQHHAPDYFQIIEADSSVECDLEIQRIADLMKVSYIVWDSYEISDKLIANVASQFPLMVLDDIYLLPYYSCDAVLNQNIYADADKYRKSENTSVLAGSQYALLRDHFLARSINKQEKREIPNILLTFGGSDPDNLTCLMLGWLSKLNMSVHLSVVTGKHYPFAQELKTIISQIVHQFDITCYQDVVQISDLFSEQDLVICAGGSTLNELACLGVPSCCIVTADNQMELAAAADRIGFCRNLGHKDNLVQDDVIEIIYRLLINDSVRKEMSRIGQQTIDGKGASRVADYILNKLT